MGTWALHSFGNDDAADLLSDLMDQNGVEPVAEAIARVLKSDGYLEAPDAQQGIAACEVVATALGKPSGGSQAEEDLASWISRVNPVFGSDIVSQATKAIDRILTPESELLELWQESDEFSDWKADVTDLRSRLQAQ